MEEKLPAIATEFEPDKAIERINKSIDFLNKLRGVLKEGEDFNKRPGYPKPSMEKPGAEKIAAGLNCGVKIVEGNEGRVIDEKYGLKEYELVVALINRASGEWVGEGVGSATATVSDLYAYDKEVRKRILKPERISWANNKAKKMAFKSGLICASLTIGVLSGYFTQDLENVSTESQSTKQDTSQKQPPKQKEENDIQEEVQNVFPETEEVEQDPKGQKTTSWDVFWKSVTNAGYKDKDRKSMNEFIAHKSKTQKMSKTDVMLKCMANFKEFILEWEQWKQ